MKRLIFVIPIAALASFFLIACRNDSSLDTSKFTVQVIDGVRYVHNHAPQLGDASSVRLELIGRIGGLESQEEKYILYDPVDAARLLNGDILILEGKGCKVKRYSQDHVFISSFGQKGQGPGDFNFPSSLRLNSDRNRLYVAANKISWFSLDGRYEGSFRPIRARMGGSSIDQQYRTSGMAVLVGPRVILPNDTSTLEDPGEHKLLAVYDETGTVLRSFGTVKQYDDPHMTLNANIAYFSTDNKDNIYIAYAFQNRIDKYSQDGKMVFSTDRYVPYKIENIMKPVLFKSGAQEQTFLWPSVTSVTKGICLDQKNRIWVLTFLRQPNKFGGFDNEDNLAHCYEFDMFDSNGILLFRVSFPNVRFNNISIYDDRIYLIDSQNEACVHEYRIVDRN